MSDKQSSKMNKEFDSNIFCQNLKRLRKNNFRSKSELSAFAEINYAYYLRIEKGSAKPSSTHLINLANALGVTIEELLYENYFDDDIDVIINDICKAIKQSNQRTLSKSLILVEKIELLEAYFKKNN